MTDIELWNHRENPRPFVPAELLDAAESVRGSLPNILRFRHRRAPVRIIPAISGAWPADRQQGLDGEVNVRQANFCG